MLDDVNDIQRGDGRIRSRGCTGGCCRPPHGSDEISIGTSDDHVRERASGGFLD
jgi:hypothetical protein